MKRSTTLVLGSVFLVALLSVSLVSASWLDDLWGGITGNVVAGDDNIIDSAWKSKCTGDWQAIGVNDDADSYHDLSEDGQSVKVRRRLCLKSPYAITSSWETPSLTSACPIGGGVPTGLWDDGNSKRYDEGCHLNEDRGKNNVQLCLSSEVPIETEWVETCRDGWEDTKLTDCVNKGVRNCNDRSNNRCVTRRKGPRLCIRQVKTAAHCDNVIYGDVDGDGLITPDDFGMVRGSFQNMVVLSVCEAKAADINCDGVVNETDVVLISERVDELLNGAPLPEDSVCGGVSCTDTDGGRIYDVKGDTIGCNGNGVDACDDIISTSDRCVDGQDFVSTGPDLYEQYCDGPGVMSERLTCLNGCDDGACLSTPVVGPPSVLVSNQVVVTGTCADAVIYGDANGDGILTANDLSVAGGIVAGAITPTDCQTKAADINCDGVINGTDVGLIQARVTGILDSAPLPEDSYCGGVVPTCTDSDGGFDYSVKGFLYNLEGDVIFSETGKGSEDTNVLSATEAEIKVGGVWRSLSLGDTYELSIGKFIVRDINVAEGSVTIDYLELPDSCDGDSLTERVCDNYGAFDYTSFTCPNGCDDGACLPDPAGDTTCTDSDGGLNYAVKGNTTGYEMSYIDWDMKEDHCGVGGDDIGKLYEYSCGFVGDVAGVGYLDEPDFINQTVYDCPGGCDAGACLPASSQAGDKCVDLDGGEFYYTKGDVIYDGKTVSDTCFLYDSYGVGRIKNSADDCVGDLCGLDESTCSDQETFEKISFACPDGCADGACIPHAVGGPAAGDGPSPGETACDLIGGCFESDTCYAVGFRLGGDYCLGSADGFADQLPGDASCSQNHECIDELCILGRCIEQSWWADLLDFLGLGGWTGDDDGDAACTDSDNGLNYTSKGTTSGTHAVQGLITHEDYCLSDTQVYEAECRQDLYGTEILLEFDAHVCLNGCFEGACLPDSADA